MKLTSAKRRNQTPVDTFVIYKRHHYTSSPQRSEVERLLRTKSPPAQPNLLKRNNPIHNMANSCLRPKQNRNSQVPASITLDMLTNVHLPTGDEWQFPIAKDCTMELCQRIIPLWDFTLSNQPTEVLNQVEAMLYIPQSGWWKTETCRNTCMYAWMINAILFVFFQLGYVSPRANISRTKLIAISELGEESPGAPPPPVISRFYTIQTIKFQHCHPGYLFQSSDLYAKVLASMQDSLNADKVVERVHGKIDDRDHCAVTPALFWAFHKFWMSLAHLSPCADGQKYKWQQDDIANVDFLEQITISQIKTTAALRLFSCNVVFLQFILGPPPKCGIGELVHG